MVPTSRSLWVFEACATRSPISQVSYSVSSLSCDHAKDECRLVDKLSTSIEQYRTVLSRLFPSKYLESLISLPREELLELALSLPAGSAISPSSSNPQTIPGATPRSDEADSLETLEQAPPEEPEWDEARKHQDKIQGISDDINGLSMSVDRISSYVGISSITAALKVIVRCAPQARP